MRACTALPPKWVSTSPGIMPAFSAGESAMIPAMSTPFSSGLSTGCTSSPVQLLATVPVLMSSSDTSLDRLAGIAPPRLPMPTSLIPTISPFSFTSGPPLLPGKITASCPSQRTSWPTFSPSRRKLPRCGDIMATFDMIPLVTDWESPAGLPMAKHTSPTCTLSESPNLATAKGLASFGRSDVRRRITAMSVMASAPIKSAAISSPSWRRQVMRVALPATWWFVTTCPLSDTITPLPVARDFSMRPDEPCSDTTSIRTMAGKVPSTASRINGSAGRLSAFLPSCEYPVAAINEKKRKVMEIRMSVVSVVDCAFRLTS